ncbi:Na+/H+ antiporter NhaA [Novosphingobium sp.]|uniref:Na+/H+ antiporter NhaA n=1 Tax=Novosphingobium sp. TaxID=1874826 RepID=UPI001ED7074E|nr:Na+/H+ antiporter NhaA [Novosphingobium sp.]MBK6802483.1 Na+/H+ antiporter NhaA [Novosphingobium sp.]MBK9009457.1 Na+/H+ antiporter NhaA [Novosphingobium sp.]
MPRNRHPFQPLATLAIRLLGGEAGAGVLLILVAALAVLLANSPLSGAYHAVLHAPLPWTPIGKLDTLHLWINDAAMAVFFFVVGLEIKREVLDGELSTPQRRRLPVLAAACGMAVPALVYLVVAGGDPVLRSGWAIPAATDIAFALGVLALLGKRAPPSLRLFLLTVAIADDLGAVVIIALFYTSGLKLAWLGGAAAVLALMVALNRLRVARGLPYVLLSCALWFAVLHSGVHATVAGVVAALTVPIALDQRGDSLLLRMEHALAPIGAYVIVPLFGLANAGVSLAGIGLAGLAAPLPMGIALGLFLGKQVGILGAIAAAERVGFAARPEGASWRQLWGMALLCGIGFTMSLFIGQLAFPGNDTLIEEAKLGVLLGSLLSALAGYALLRSSPQAPSRA